MSDQEPTKDSTLVTSIIRGLGNLLRDNRRMGKDYNLDRQKGYVLAKYLVDSADKVDKVVVKHLKKIK